VTSSSHESAKRQDLGSTSRVAFSQPADAYVRKLRAIDRLAMEIVSRVEKTLQETPKAILDKQSTMLPAELEDSQAYFLQKIAHARDTLQELSGLLPANPQGLDLREEITVELMILFVLIENYRPERMAESGFTTDEQMRRAIHNRIESLSLDLINMRERLK